MANTETIFSTHVDENFKGYFPTLYRNITQGSIAGCAQYDF